MYQPGSDALTGCPDNAPDDDGEEIMESVDGFRIDCPEMLQMMMERKLWNLWMGSGQTVQW